MTFRQRILAEQIALEKIIALVKFGFVWRRQFLKNLEAMLKSAGKGE